MVTDILMNIASQLLTMGLPSIDQSLEKLLVDGYLPEVGCAGQHRGLRPCHRLVSRPLCGVLRVLDDDAWT